MKNLSIMQKALPLVAISLILVFQFSDSSALRQVAGPIIVDIKPGESKTFEWGLASDREGEITTVEISAEGDGAEFLSFEKSLQIDPQALIYATVTVNVPADYPGGIEISPHLIATEYGESGGATVINIRMLKVVTLNVAPNDNPDLRVDWEAMKKSEVDEEPVEPEPSVVANEDEQKPGGLQIQQAQKSEQTPDDSKGGCLIATAAFGTELAPQVQLLREVRDGVLFSTSTGTSFMSGFNSVYYTFSSTVADWERDNPAFKEIVKLAITPMLSTLSILNYVEIDSESEMLGYGIGIILLNLGMYFVAPAILLVKLERKLRK